MSLRQRAQKRNGLAPPVSLESMKTRARIAITIRNTRHLVECKKSGKSYGSWREFLHVLAVVSGRSIRDRYALSAYFHRSQRPENIPRARPTVIDHYFTY